MSPKIPAESTEGHGLGYERHITGDEMHAGCVLQGSISYRERGFNLIIEMNKCIRMSNRSVKTCQESLFNTLTYFLKGAEGKGQHHLSIYLTVCLSIYLSVVLWLSLSLTAWCVCVCVCACFSVCTCVCERLTIPLVSRQSVTLCHCDW